MLGLRLWLVESGEVGFPYQAGVAADNIEFGQIRELLLLYLQPSLSFWSSLWSSDDSRKVLECGRGANIMCWGTDPCQGLLRRLMMSHTYLR
jgi:hypothetical protein